jgi:hypothetical protein
MPDRHLPPETKARSALPLNARSGLLFPIGPLNPPIGTPPGPKSPIGSLSPDRARFRVNGYKSDRHFPQRDIFRLAFRLTQPNWPTADRHSLSSKKPDWHSPQPIGFLKLPIGTYKKAPKSPIGNLTHARSAI